MPASVVCLRVALLLLVVFLASRNPVNFRDVKHVQTVFDSTPSELTDVSSYRGHPVLLSFLSLVPDTAASPSRAQFVLLQSMSKQYAAKGLRLFVVDATTLGKVHKQTTTADLTNARYDWNFGNTPLLAGDNALASRYAITHPATTLLLDGSGSVRNRWERQTAPAELATAIESLIGGPMNAAKQSPEFISSEWQGGKE